METEVLDAGHEPVKNDLTEALRWWEKQRIWFNVVVGISGVLSIILFAPFFGSADLVGIVVYGILANIFYSMGFVAEALNLYYLGNRIELRKYRLVLFVLGTTGSCIITFVGVLSFYWLYFI